MRTRLALPIVLLVPIGALIGALSPQAASAQSVIVESDPAAPDDPYLRILGVPGAGGAMDPVHPGDPPVSFSFEAVDDGDGQAGNVIIASPDGVYTLDGGDAAYRYLLGADGALNLHTMGPEGLASLYALGGGGQVQLRATLDDRGNVRVWMGSHELASDRVEKSGSTVRVKDGEGRLIATFEIDGEGRVTIPAGWSFSGPPQYLSERPSRRVIGIRTGAVEPALARHLGLGDGEGILVTEVIDGHPAAAAGLQPLDVIVAVDGARPATLESLKDALAEKSEGDTISLTVVRAGRTMEIRSGVSSVSAPIGANRMPEGTYAFGLGGPGAMAGMAGGDPGAGAAGGDVPLLGGSLPLLLRRSAEGSASGQSPLRGSGGAWRAAPGPGGMWGGQNQPGVGVFSLEEAHPGTTAPDGGAERLGSIEERLARLEKLLEELVEQRQKVPGPRERH